jgi:hypothetical protein
MRVDRIRVRSTKRNKREAMRNAGGVYEHRFRRKMSLLAQSYPPVYPHVTTNE